MIALGKIDPGMEFYEAITEGKSEAVFMKAQYDAIRSNT